MSRGLVGVSPREMGLEGEVAYAREQNILLINKLNVTYADACREIFSDPNTFGLRVEEIRKRLQEKADISTRHADLIARDQTLKLNAAITRIRMQNAGITHYTWSTSQDERVRLTHAALEGQVFSWAVGTPIGYHPGEDYQCRCTAIAYFGDAEEESDEDEEGL